MPWLSLPPPRSPLLFALTHLPPPSPLSLLPLAPLLPCLRIDAHNGYLLPLLSLSLSLSSSSRAWRRSLTTSASSSARFASATPTCAFASATALTLLAAATDFESRKAFSAATARASAAVAAEAESEQRKQDTATSFFFGTFPCSGPAVGVTSAGVTTACVAVAGTGFSSDDAGCRGGGAGSGPYFLTSVSIMRSSWPLRFARSSSTCAALWGMP
mmetsp:Transcript_28291/g.47861  ORF Transcript_28291/g.47861 Transcript_28291/m.47861 type:complete len:215 (-) Transcript_28291:137-781(-)